MIPGEYVLAAVALIASGVVLISLRVLAAVVEQERRWHALIRDARQLRTEYARKLAQLQDRGRARPPRAGGGGGDAPAPDVDLVAEPVDAPAGEDSFDVDIIDEPGDDPTVAHVGSVDGDPPARAAA